MPDGTTTIKEPVVAAVISFLIPGSGQAYNGQVKKGIAILAGYIVLWIALFVVYLGGGILISLITAGIGSLALLCCWPVFFAPLLINLWAAYDAYKTAGRINAGEAIKDWLA